MDVVRKDETIALQKRNRDVGFVRVPTEKRKHKKNKDYKEVLSSSEVPKDVLLECATDLAASKGKGPIGLGSEEHVKRMKKRKGKKDKRDHEIGGDSGESCIEKSGGEAQYGYRSSKKRHREDEVLDVATGKGNKKKKKQTKLDANIGDVETKINFGSTTEHLKNLDSERVKFASRVGFFRSFHERDNRIFRAGLKKGRWSQREIQSLIHLVNKNLRMLVYGEKMSNKKISKHEMISDNISWGAISNCLATRNGQSCCLMWYHRLSPCKGNEWKWANTDDYRLLYELHKLDAFCGEDVDWDNLLKHRSGDKSLKRWRQMVNHIGDHALLSFPEQVEELTKRYFPELLESRPFGWT